MIVTEQTRIYKEDGLVFLITHTPIVTWEDGKSHPYAEAFYQKLPTLIQTISLQSILPLLKQCYQEDTRVQKRFLFKTAHLYCRISPLPSKKGKERYERTLTLSFGQQQIPIHKTVDIL